MAGVFVVLSHKWVLSTFWWTVDTCMYINIQKQTHMYMHTSYDLFTRWQLIIVSVREIEENINMYKCTGVSTCRSCVEMRLGWCQPGQIIVCTHYEDCDVHVHGTCSYILKFSWFMSIQHVTCTMLRENVRFIHSSYTTHAHVHVHVCIHACMVKYRRLHVHVHLLL